MDETDVLEKEIFNATRFHCPLSWLMAMFPCHFLRNVHDKLKKICGPLYKATVNRPKRTRCERRTGC